MSVNHTAKDARERLTEVLEEVDSVVQLLDGLAELWGDEAVFRRCRDRLKALLTKGAT